MNVHAHPRRRAPELVRAALLLVLGVASLPAPAQERLGPVDNILLRNPYADAADGQYGRGIAAGDFNGDGIGDLAVAENGGGRVRVLLGLAWTVGGPDGLHFVATTVPIPANGYALASGDFDGDGRDEIAVGAPNLAIGGSLSAGKVYVLDRASGGTWSVQSEIAAGGAYPGATQNGAQFGTSLAVGDFDDDGRDDLAIGIRGQTVAGAENAGAVMVAYGSASGIGATGARLLNRGNDGLGFAPNEDDRFGWSVAAGDFDNDGDADLAIGVYGGTCPNGTDRAGAVIVLQGSSANGITNAQSHIWRPGVLGVAGSCATAGRFGMALVAGRFDFNSEDDLAIGAPQTTGGGAVHVLYGSGTGLTASGNQRFLAPALPNDGSRDSAFGNALATGRLRHRCSGIICAGESLAIGAPFAAVDGLDNAGAVWVVDASVGGTLDADTIAPILPSRALRIGGAHTNDQFGNILASADFNDDNRDDLAIGTYLYDDGATSDAGAVQLVFQSEFLFVDGFD